MASIPTVTGPIESSELGRTLIHEHLVSEDEAVHMQWPHLGTVKEQDDMAVDVPAGGQFDVAVECLRGAMEHGVKSMADPSAMFLGRDIDLMRRVSEETGMQIVPCTGIYTYEHLPPYFALRDADAMADCFVHDIEEGIQGTDAKAAFIKVAADEPGVTENIEKTHRAAARASVRTGKPIMAHTRPASNTGPRQIEIFLEEGVDPAKIHMAHTGDTDDLDYIEGLLEKGVWIGMDRYGLEIFLPAEQRNKTVLALLERGYAERMFLSQDYCATIDWYPVELANQLQEGGLVKGWGMTLIFEEIIPTLREGGMTDEQLETMLVDNPRRWLSGD
jgi:phosphotriesterase-related protein